MQGVLSELLGLDVKHEYTPHCHAEAMRDLNNNDTYSEETNRDLDMKVLKIRRVEGDYVDVGQGFMKSYIYRFIDEFDDMDCIHLFRDPKEVMESWKSRKPSQQEKWHLKSHWKKNLTRTNHILPEYENWEWECGEIAARFKHYKPYFRRTFEFDFRDLNDPSRWRELFSEFDIEYKAFDSVPDVFRNESESKLN